MSISLRLPGYHVLAANCSEPSCKESATLNQGGTSRATYKSTSRSVCVHTRLARLPLSDDVGLQVIDPGAIKSSPGPDVPSGAMQAIWNAAGQSTTDTATASRQISSTSDYDTCFWAGARSAISRILGASATDLP